MPLQSGAANQRSALVLPAGGARAAYQVGVLKYLGDHFPEFDPVIFAGVSAGSINSCFLAQGKPFPQASRELYSLWEKLEFRDVFRTNFSSLLRFGGRWVYDFFLSRITKKLLVKSLFDASPLADTLLNHIHFWQITRAVRAGRVWGIAVSATNYHDGSTAIFFDSHRMLTEWKRMERRSIRTSIRAKHVMASCSIPILFEPIRIGDSWYGDGSLRFNFPFSPVIHMGATDIFAVGNRCPKPKSWKKMPAENVTVGFVAGAVLNSIFTNSIETDYDNLRKLNDAESGTLRRIGNYLQSPSEHFGEIASNFLNDVPFHLRQGLKSISSAKEMGDLLSYLLFSPGYIRELLKLGYEDGKNSHQEIEQFMKGIPSQGSKKSAEG